MKKGKGRREIIEKMKKKLKEEYLSRDMLLVHGEGMLKDLDKTINILFERLNEWYSLYFPELTIEDRKKYCKLILAIDKKDLEKSKKEIMEILGEKGKQIAEKLAVSGGIEFSEKDMKKIKEISQEIIDMIQFKESTEKYVDSVAKEVCPNMTEVGGPRIASKLVAHIGGLKKLATLPASTIQVLGAEKALFKHLRKKTKPPKHGIIFQHTAIHSAPKQLRGKIARALATKLSMAVKIDAYKGKFIGDKLREKFDAKVKSILEKKKAE